MSEIGSSQGMYLAFTSPVCLVFGLNSYDESHRFDIEAEAFLCLCCSENARRPECLPFIKAVSYRACDNNVIIVLLKGKAAGQAKLLNQREGSSIKNQVKPKRE